MKTRSSILNLFLILQINFYHPDDFKLDNSYAVKCVFDVAFSYETLAFCESNLGEYRDAVSHLKKALYNYDRVFQTKVDQKVSLDANVKPGDNAFKANCLYKLAYCFGKRGYWDKQLEYAFKAYSMRLRIYKGNLFI